MLNSESKLSSHFVPLETKSADNNTALFSIILFALEGSDDLRAWKSLEQQTMNNWDLIIVSPPSGNKAFFDSISKKPTERAVLSADFTSISKILETRNSHYISFINQDTTWISEKLSHEYAIFSSSSAVMLFSAPLVIPDQPEGGARIPRYPLKPNQSFTGGTAFHALVKIANGEQFFIDSISVRRKELLGYFDGRMLSFLPAIDEIAGKENVFFSDKCLVELHVPPGMGLHDSETLVTDTSDLHADAPTSDVGEKDIFEARPAAQAFETQIRELEVARDAARSELAAVLSSTSWRLTAPLRRVLRGHPAIRRNVRRTLKLVWWTITLQLRRKYIVWRRNGNASSSSQCIK